MPRSATKTQRLKDIGAIVAEPNTPDEFAQFIAADAAKWAKVIQSRWD